MIKTISQDKISEFQSIVKLLVEFDEKTGRHQRYANPHHHYSRKAVSVCKDESLKIYIRDLGGFVYQIVCVIDESNTFIITQWIHEDGIRAERVELQDSPEHPVHKIVCVSDLYECATIADESGDIDSRVLAAFDSVEAVA